MADFGAFSVQAVQIAGLGGANFGQFVNRLLDLETARHGMTGTTLTTTYKENVGDEGVDAGLQHATATKWLPAGDSAWQFKAGDLQPGECKTEIAGATRALDIIRSGGKYRLALGATLTDAKITRRKTAIEEQLIALGITIDDETVQVLTADSLARWAEEYPALAVSPLLGGPGTSAQTFDEWSRSILHTTTWVSSEDRDNQIEELRALILGGEQIDVHLDGVSGLGKTRLVLEAIRGQAFEALTVYAPYADQFPIAYLNQLQSQGRTGIIVIDECDSKLHDIYRSVLQTGTSLRLVTIGEPGGVSTRSPMLGVIPLADGAMAQLLQKNAPNLWQEAIRVIVEVAAGNVDYALKAAQALLADGATSAGSLVSADDIRRFITDKLPGGALFLACCALALFSRFGFEREVADELTTISAGLGIQESDLKAAAVALTDAALLTKQGRYRSVGPYPVAIHLATRGWQEFGERILTDLLPALDDDLAERLFRRAADIGDTDATRAALASLLKEDGPLASLEVLASGNNSKLLTHFAVLAPRQISDRLAELLDSASDHEIEAVQSSRRNLVWTLEKLAWHSETFETAADSLLRLALVETEKFSNNATGTWVDFFGAMLPGTAASPDTRMRYLEAWANSSNDKVRGIAAKAAAHALNVHESIMVSGELQGGAVVERRGAPATRGDLWRYRNSAIDVLAKLANDSNADTASDALKTLCSSIHAVLETDPVRDHLAGVLAGMNDYQLRQVRTEINSLESLFARVDNAAARSEGLDKLKAILPEESATDLLWALARGNPWDRMHSGMEHELVDAAKTIPDVDPTDSLIGLLSEKVPAAFEVGRAIAITASNHQSTLAQLAPQLDGQNPDALVGFLRGCVDAGDVDAFDRFIDGSDLTASVKLRLTATSPRTARASERIDELLPEVPVSEAARVLFSWARELDASQILGYVTSWLANISSQDDYNAVVDFVALQLHGQEGTPVELQPIIQELVSLRRDYSSLGQQEWDWTQLALRQLARDPEGLALLLADLVESGALSTYDGSEEGRLFQDAVRAGGVSTWTEIMDRIVAGSWRLSFAGRGWLAEAVEFAAAATWVGDSLERARTLASVASIGGESISEVGKYLLDEFDNDDRISSSLVGEFISGFWSGNESDRIAGQVTQVRGWLDAQGQSRPVKRWARRLLAHLEAQLVAVLEREQEGDW